MPGLLGWLGIKRAKRYGAFMASDVGDDESIKQSVAQISSYQRRIKIILTGIIDFDAGAVTDEPQFTLAEAQLIVATAREHGRSTFAHCSGQKGLAIAAQAGVGSIEHGFFMNRETLALMRDRQVGLDTDLCPVFFQWAHPDAVGWSANTVGHLRRILDSHAEHLRLAHDMGVPLLLGTDAGSMGVEHGKAMLDEIERYVEAGLPLNAVLTAATASSRRHLGVADPVLQPGASFEAMLLPASPFDQLLALQTPIQMWRARRAPRWPDEPSALHHVRCATLVRSPCQGLRRVYEFFSRLAPWLTLVAWVMGTDRLAAVLAPIEKHAKGLMFDCQMCGQCVLSATGMACPMNCAKSMRNGPCGEVRPNGNCEVKPDMPCVWVEATDGTKRIAPDHKAHPTPLLPAVDQRKRGASTWIQVVQGRKDPAFQAPVGERITPEAQESPFEQACRSDRFVVTVEIAPPDSADPAVLLARAERFRGLVDAMNITDGAGGNRHMSSVAASAILASKGLNPVYQIACRDRNRIAIQGDILGAALGVSNILYLTGDDVSQGDHPQAKPVFDLDAVSLLHVARGMVDRGEYASGRKLLTPPRLFIGATTNPFVPPYIDCIANLEKKMVAGARFIQTQFCFDVPLLEEFMQQVRARGLHQRARIIVGVGTLSNAKALRWIPTMCPACVSPRPFCSALRPLTIKSQGGKSGLRRNHTCGTCH